MRIRRYSKPPVNCSVAARKPLRPWSTPASGCSGRSCHSISGSRNAAAASDPSRLNTSIARRTASTFSCGTRLLPEPGDSESLRAISVHTGQRHPTVADGHDLCAGSLNRSSARRASRPHAHERHHPIPYVDGALGLEAPLGPGVAKHRGKSGQPLSPRKDRLALRVVSWKPNLALLVEIVPKSLVEDHLIISGVRQIGESGIPLTVLSRFDPVGIPCPEELRPEFGHPPDSLSGADLRGEVLDIGVDRAHEVQVLGRRLFLKPHGFEGFGVVDELFNDGNSSVVERCDLRPAHVTLNAAAHPVQRPAQADKNSVSLSEILDLLDADSRS